MTGPLEALPRRVLEALHREHGRELLAAVERTERAADRAEVAVARSKRERREATS